jgi:peptidoglycan/LPS O-acetylase OafA/YrhL
MIKNQFNTAAHGLRGIASLMVFFAHLLGGVGKHVYQGSPHYLDFIQRPWNFGVYGVELFFVISGFVIVPSVAKYSQKSFAARRFVRIYPLFFVMSVIFVVSNAWTLRQPELNDPLTIVSGFLFLNLFTGTEQLTPNAWTLTYEVIFYSIICFSFYAWRPSKGAFYRVAAICVCLIFVLYFPISIYFALGVIIRYLFEKKYVINGKYAKALEIIFAAACIYLASRPHFNYTWETMRNPALPLTMLFTGLYFYLAVSPESITTALVKNRTVTYLGVVSYSLYLVHPYTYLLCRLLFVKFGLFSENTTLSMILFFLVTTPLTMIATHVFHVVLERVPYQFAFGQGIYNWGKQKWPMKNPATV